MEPLPVFERDANGYLLPGPIVRYFREHMTYTNINGKPKRGTQDDLARQLGLTRLAIQNMENRNMGLDSIERRRTLAALLKIPLALLGLASLDEEEKFTHSEQKPTRKEIVDTSEIQLYQSALHVFKEQYEQGLLPIQTIETWIARIIDATEQTHGKLKDASLTELTKYHILAGNIYYHDSQNLMQAKHHLSRAKEIAGMLDNNELLAVAYYHTGELYGNNGDYRLARIELDHALTHSKWASHQVRGNVLTMAASCYGLSSTDESDRVNIRHFLDEADGLITNDVDNNTLMRFDIVQYLESKADALVCSKRYGLALECIDETEEYLLIRKRNIEYLKILRAECYSKQKKPEYEEAIRLLSQVLSNNNSIQYYVSYVARLHKIIATSSYGNSPNVVNLGMQLRKLRAK